MLKSVSLLLIACSLLFGQSGSFPPVPASGAGSGSVVTVDGTGQNGVETTQEGSLGAITASGAVRGVSLINSQTGTSYTLVTSDRGKLVVLSNDASVALTLPQAGLPSFPSGWYVDITNVGTGAVSVAPDTSLLDGGANTISLAQYQGVRIVSNGVDYVTMRGYTPPVIQPPPTPGYTPNQIESGCGVQHTAGLSFTVGACNYRIAGSSYSSPLMPLTLGAADMTNPRIDVIIVDITGVASVLPGIPAASPQQPTSNAATDLDVTFVYVAANATSPGDVTTDNIYDEGTEWTLTTTANIANGTNSPYTLTHSLEATNAILNRNFQLVKPAAGTVDLATRNFLLFYIKSKATWPTGTSGATAARYLSIWWENGTTQRGNTVLLKSGNFGFNSSNTSAYQQVAIPTSLFGANGIPVTKLRFQVSGPAGSATIGWYIDNISLQGGLTAPTVPATSMNFRGAWSAATAYSVNDVVTSGSRGYIALVANTNVAVTTTATWSPLGYKTLVSGDIPANAANTSGTAAFASALDHNPSACGAGTFTTDVDASLVLTCTAVAESVVTFTDITTNDSSTSKHGYLKKLDNDATHFMNGQGTWATATTTVQHPISFAFDGGGTALTTSLVAYFALPYACTIQAYQLWADTGTFTVKFWKIATGGTALPTVANVINTSGVALSTGTKVRSTTLSDFTTATITALDFGAVTITAVSGATKLGGVLECQ